jgi:hypothetical protein
MSVAPLRYLPALASMNAHAPDANFKNPHHAKWGARLFHSLFKMTTRAPDVILNSLLREMGACYFPRFSQTSHGHQYLMAFSGSYS